MSETSHNQPKINVSITPAEIVALLSLLYAIPIVFAQVRMFHVAKESAWASSIIAGVCGALVILVWSKLLNDFPNKTLPEIVTSVLGPWLGWVVNFVFMFHFLIETAVGSRLVGEVMLRLLPDTPLLAIVLGTTVTGTVLARLGPGAIGRLSLIHVGVVTASMIFIVVTLFSMIDSGRFRPLLAVPASDLVIASFPLIGFMGHAILLSFLVAYIPSKRAKPATNWPVWKIGIIGMGTSWLFFFILLLLSQGVFGAFETPRLTLPVLSLVRSIKIGAHFERVEASLVALWLPSAFLKVGIFLYSTSVMAASLVRTPTHVWLTMPLALVSVPISLMLAKNITHLTYLINGTWALVQIAVKILIPACLLLIIPLKARLER